MLFFGYRTNFCVILFVWDVFLSFISYFTTSFIAMVKEKVLCIFYWKLTNSLSAVLGMNTEYKMLLSHNNRLAYTWYRKHHEFHVCSHFLCPWYLSTYQGAILFRHLSSGSQFVDLYPFRGQISDISIAWFIKVAKLYFTVGVIIIWGTV